MTLTLPKPACRTPHNPRGEEADREVRHDPAGLSATLRDLAVRAHHAVRVAEGLATSPGAAEALKFDSRQELAELQEQIDQLQRDLHDQSLDGLTPYVAALGQKVSSVIGFC
jgi:hypothetical protein